MSRTSITVLVISWCALLLAVFYGVAITGDRNALHTELKSVQNDLTSTLAELDSTRQTLEAELGNTRLTLFSTQQTLALTQAELGSTEQALTSMQAELEATRETLTSTQQTLAAVQYDWAKLQASLTTTQQQLATAEETLAGLGITVYASPECHDVPLIDNPGATNPTWSQLLAFLSQEQTDKQTYIENSYDCSQFSRDVHNNAEAAGIRAAEVQVWFRNEKYGHALNAFLTTDYGLVYVDCTLGDYIARVYYGKTYRAVGLYSITGTNVRNNNWWDALSSYYYIPTASGGESVTSGISIYW